jgi:hypothetical protein
LESTKFIDSKNTEEAKSKEETTKISEGDSKNLVTKKATQFTDKSSAIMQPISLLE